MSTFDETRNRTGYIVFKACKKNHWKKFKNNVINLIKKLKGEKHGEQHSLLNSSSVIATENVVDTYYLKWTNRETVLYYLALW